MLRRAWVGSRDGVGACESAHHRMRPQKRSSCPRKPRKRLGWEVSETRRLSENTITHPRRWRWSTIRWLKGVRVREGSERESGRGQPCEVKAGYQTEVAESMGSTGRAPRSGERTDAGGQRDLPRRTSGMGSARVARTDERTRTAERRDNMIRRWVADEGSDRIRRDSYFYADTRTASPLIGRPLLPSSSSSSSSSSLLPPPSTTCLSRSSLPLCSHQTLDGSPQNASG